MKRTGLMAVVLATAVTVACGGGARDEANNENPGTTVGTGGEIGDNREVNETRTNDTRGVQDFVHDIGMHNTA